MSRRTASKVPGQETMSAIEKAVDRIRKRCPRAVSDQNKLDYARLVAHLANRHQRPINDDYWKMTVPEWLTSLDELDAIEAERARESQPPSLTALRKAFPALLRTGSVANRIMAHLINATEPMSVLSLSGGKGASGGARRNARAALESLEREGLAVRKGDRWERGPATRRQ